MTTQRWVLHDDLTGETWTMPINPISMSPLSHGRKQLRFGNGMHKDRRVRTLVGAPRVVEWSFGGPIRTRAHHDALASWARRTNTVTITDHIGRTLRVYFTSFEPTDRRPNALTKWRMRYTMKCYLLEVS